MINKNRKPAEDDFNPDEYMKERGIPDTADFDPDAYMQERGIPNVPSPPPTQEAMTAQAPEVPQEHKGMALDALYQAIAKGGLLRIVSPSTIQAKIARAIEPGNAALEKQGFRFNEQSPEEYFKTREKELANKYPGTTLAGELAGSIPTSAVLGMPAKGLSAAHKVIYGLGEGAALGAAGNADQNLGIAERIKNAGVGTAVAAIPTVAKEVGKSIGPGLKNLVKKTVSAASGIPIDSIEQFRKREKQILELGKKFGGNVQEAADFLRSQFNSEIQDAKSKLSKATTDFIEKHGKNVVVDVTPLYEKLYNIASKLNKDSPSDKLIAGDLKKIFDEIKAFSRTDIEFNDKKNPVKAIIKSFSPENKNSALATGSELYSLKQKLQSLADDSYFKAGSIFQGGDKAARAAKQVASEARRLLHREFSGIKKVDDQYSMLHEIEQSMNRNMLKEGVTPNSLMTAAKEGTPGAKQLKRLGRFTKTDIPERVKDLSAMSYFHNPEPMPLQSTGRAGIGAFTGQALGGVFGEAGRVAGGALGAAAASPLLNKWALQGLNRAGSMKPGPTMEALKRMYPGVSSSIINRLRAMEE